MLPGAAGAAMSLALLPFIRRRRAAGAGWFAVMAAAVGGWSALQVVSAGVMPMAAKIAVFKIQYVPILTVAPAFFCFAAAYTGRERLASERVARLLFSMQCVTLLIVWTNEFHSWFWKRIFFRAATGLNGFRPWGIEYGPWFPIATALQYGLVLSAVLLLVVGLAQTQRRFGVQMIALAVASIVVLVSNVAYLL